MTDDEAAEKMKTLETGDLESDHLHADALLCDLLLALGYKKTVNAFTMLDKWYA